jgi:CRISPR/Cas system-associated exonuclease Cas4 (RecB family)
LGDVVLDGRLDTAVQIDGRWHIIDYKTDAVSHGTFASYSKKYYDQLALYAIALELCFGIQDDIVGILYFTQCRESISFTFSKQTRDAISQRLEQFPSQIFNREFAAPKPETCQGCPYYFVNPQCPTTVAYY